MSSSNEEDMCIGVSVIDAEDGQHLSIRRLINVQENSAWYVDARCRWNGEGWQIENTSTGSAYVDKLIY